MNKKNRIKKLSVLLAACLFIALFAGCSGSDTPAVTTTTTKATTASASTTQTETQTETEPTETTQAEIDLTGQSFSIITSYDYISYYDKNYDPELPTYDGYKMYLDFKEKYNFTFENIVMPFSEMYERIIAGEMSGQPAADIWAFHTGYYYDGNPLTAIKEGFISPLDDILNLDYPGFDENYKELFMYNGKTYGVVPRTPYVPTYLVTFANKSLLEDAGLDPDEIQQEAIDGDFTWEKLETYGRRVAKDTNGDGINDIIGFAVSSYKIEEFAQTNNISPIIKVGDRYVSGLMDKKYIDAMNFIYENTVEGIATMEFEAFKMFRENKIGFIITDMMQAANHAWVEVLGDKKMLLPPPKGPEATEYIHMVNSGTWSYYIPNSVSEDKKPKVGRFLEIWMNVMTGHLGEDPAGEREAEMAEITRTKTWMPWAAASIEDIVVFDMLDILPKVNNFYFLMPGFNEIIMPVREEIILRENTPSVAIAKINDLWQKAIDEFYGQ